MKVTDSYLKKKLLKVFYFFITGFPGNLLFPHYLLKLEKPASEPSPCHTMINRFTKQHNTICYQGMVLRLERPPPLPFTKIGITWATLNEKFSSG